MEWKRYGADHSSRAQGLRAHTRWASAPRYEAVERACSGSHGRLGLSRGLRPIAKLAGDQRSRARGRFSAIGYLSPEQAMGLEVDPPPEVSRSAAWTHPHRAARWEATTAKSCERHDRQDGAISSRLNPEPAAVAELLARMTALDGKGAGAGTPALPRLRFRSS